jgi:indole-3-pyruvate monooxygenase
MPGRQTEGYMANETYGDVVIIGAGPAGLATAACLRARAVPFDIIEKDSTVASSWRARYERLRLHTVKHSSGLPMMPFPREYPRYVPRDLMIRYLQDYAERFDLRPRFNQTVRSVRRADDGWFVKTDDGLRCVRTVVVATGYSAVPHLPSIEGSDRFAGPMLHSSSYVNARPFEGRSVLVVGLGNSGAEIALDLAENGAQTTLSVRAATYLARRDPFGVPIQQLSILSAFLPATARDKIFRLILDLTVGNLRKYGIERPVKGVTAWAEAGKIPVLDVGTLARIRDQTIAVRGEVSRFSEKGAIFRDGRSLQFDAVVFATGFRSGLPQFIEEGDILTACGLPIPNRRASELYFIGFVNPLTGLLRAISQEARAVAQRIASGG